MKRALLLLCLSTAAGAGERVLLETETSRDTYFVHEQFRLTLRIAFDRGFFESNAIQMFPRELDVPVHVQAPWLEELKGALLKSAKPSTGVSLALNDDVVEAVPGKDRQVDGRPYAVLEITRTCVPVRPGELFLEAPRLRFAYATKFQEDFVHGRLALDRRDEVVSGSPVTLKIRALPEEGRPPGFTGAVGRRFSVHADAAPRTLEAGAVFKLALRIEGDGDLERFEAPRLDDLAGRFHVYGRIDDRGATRRTITYDVAPLRAAVSEVPAIPFVYFDPGDPPGYRTVETVPIPLTVKNGAEPRPEPPPTEASRRGLAPFVAPLVAALVCAIALAALLWFRVRRRAAPAPGPAAVFEAHVETDVTAAFTGYLAARLQCPPAAVIGPDLPKRLTAAGVPALLAEHAATLLEGLVATRYGATATDDRAETDARAVVEELEAAFQ